MLLTPEMATQLLEHNTHNRPIQDQHVKRIAGQIVAGKWKYNGDTIKVSVDGGVLDGQHRLWAVVESKIPIETVIVHGIEREAFSTIDTLRRPRSGADVLALNGVNRYRAATSSALQWLIRWQRGSIENYRDAKSRVENSDVELAYHENASMERAIERVQCVKGLVNPSLLGFFYFVLANRSPELAERMVNTLANPAGVAINDPFFRLRMYFNSDRTRKDPIVTIALMIKAANAAFYGREVKNLNWISQGQKPEPFPKLEVLTNIEHVT